MSSPSPHRPPRAAAQTELFPAATGPSAPPVRAAAPAPAGKPAPESAIPARRADARDSDGRAEAVALLLETAAPVRAGSPEAAWLKARRVFRKTWDAQGLRVVSNYRRAADALIARFPLDALVTWGLFNKDGHLRFYRHTLLIPWVDGGRPVYLQARSPDDAAKPPELAVAGPIPCPYNARLLDGAPGRLYLCAGALNALELLEAGFPAVGVPDVPGLKTAWLPRFRGKSVYLAFDATPDGEAAATHALAALAGAGVEAHRLEVPPGRRVGDWLAGR